MVKSKIIILNFIFLLMSSRCFSMVYDNRFIPLFKRPYSKKTEALSRFGADFFALSASEGMGEHGTCVEIPGIFGEYCQGNLGKALEKLGCPNPIRDDLQSRSLPWKIEGKINAQGVSFILDKSLTENFYFGCSCLLMSVHSQNMFRFNKQESQSFILGDDCLDLNSSRATMHDMIGICSPNYHQVGFGDIDFYLRVGKVMDYVCKNRRIDLGFSIGCLFPTGCERDINIPSSIPFGGDGHFGLYVHFDSEFELKEDLKLGILARISKRIPKEKIQRLPIAKEHLLFGALRAPVKVSPGLTFLFNPYFSWENLRKGLGIRIGYTINYHDKDTWCDLRSKEDKEKTPAQTSKINNLSSWAYDYVNLNVFYDFGNLKFGRELSPIVTLTWDWPTLWFVGRSVPRTHKVSLALDLIF